MSSGDTQEDMFTSSPEETKANSSFKENDLWDFLNENCDAILEKILKQKDLSQITERIIEQDNTIQQLREENQELRRRLAIAEGAVTRSELAIDKLEERVTDLTTRSMRDNIIIKNMSEERGEDESKIEAKTLTFFEKELKISAVDMSKISVEKAHRMGKPIKGKTRNVVVRLNSKGKTIVMQHLKNLEKRNPIKVSEQYPPEVHSQRDKLWPMFIDAKQKGKPAKWSQEQLIIEGRTHKPPKDRNRNINMDTTESALKLRVKHTAVTTKDAGHFQAHLVDISSQDDVVPAIKALCADTRVAGASHVTYAYRVGTEQHCIHNWEDDGQWGVGRWIMREIEEHNAYNKLVCITKWHGGRNIQKARFDTIKELVNAAL